ncbi:MAG: DUF4154 domain-containing protein [Candidatus Kapabacteria bacterium]|jgi:hypothetical protein|nr:DUF4154 domain-containing protein [Candidatus Kapabacteria bacterium]
MKNVFQRYNPVFIIVAIAVISLGFIIHFETLKPAPAKIQTVLYKKIFSYCKVLVKDGVNVAVLADDTNPEIDEIIRGFGNIGISVTEVKSEKIYNQSKFNVLYVAKSSKSIVSQCNSKGILCLSSTPDDVQENLAALSIYSENNKPKIIVNMLVLKSQNHEISSEVLKLATIVGD